MHPKRPIGKFLNLLKFTILSFLYGKKLSILERMDNLNTDLSKNYYDWGGGGGVEFSNLYPYWAMKTSTIDFSKTSTRDVANENIILLNIVGWGL